MTTTVRATIETTTCSTTSPLLSSSQQCVVGFGSNYYHGLGGTIEATLLEVDEGDEDRELDPDCTGMTVNAHVLHEPPWHTGDKKDCVEQIACTSGSTVFLTSSGHVYQVGTLHGRQWTSPTRVEIALPLKCVQLAAGRHFCLGRLEGGLGVVSWGAGHFGQLGQGPHTSHGLLLKPQLIQHLLPQQALGGVRIQQVAAGAWHALALLEDGRCFGWGSNRSYQCGVKRTESTSNGPPTLAYPHPVETNVLFSFVTCGKSHSVALEKDTGRVYTWGASHFGQCGHSSRRGCITPPRLVEALQRVAIVGVAAGDAHTLALTGGGRVFGWGAGAEGELGVAPPVWVSRPKFLADLDFVAIEAGQEYKYPTKPTEIAAPPAPSFSASPLTPPRTLAQDRPSSQEEIPFLPPIDVNRPHLSQIPKIVHIEATGSYSVAISSAGHVYTWGYNDVGALGLSTPSHSLSFMETPHTHSQQSIKSSSRMLQVHTFDSRHNVLLPRRLDALRDFHIVGVAGGPGHLWCWGKPRTADNKPVVVGRTLYEVQEGRRRKGMLRMRKRLSAPRCSLPDHDSQGTDDPAVPLTTNDEVDLIPSILAVSTDDTMADNISTTTTATGASFPEARPQSPALDLISSVSPANASVSSQQPTQLRRDVSLTKLLRKLKPKSPTDESAAKVGRARRALSAAFGK